MCVNGLCVHPPSKPREREREISACCVLCSVCFVYVCVCELGVYGSGCMGVC